MCIRDSFITGFRETVANLLLGLNLPGWATMIVILMILTVLGTFLDVIALIMISVPIFLPIAIHSGYDAVWFGVIMVAVSYTHLLAHETVLELVCRLLLEKKNTCKKKKQL